MREGRCGRGEQEVLACSAAWLVVTTDVAIEAADVVLMRSDPLDVPVALTIGRGTLRKMRRMRRVELGDA